MVYSSRVVWSRQASSANLVYKTEIKKINERNSHQWKAPHTKLNDLVVVGHVTIRYVTRSESYGQHVPAVKFHLRNYEIEVSRDNSRRRRESAEDK